MPRWRNWLYALLRGGSGRKAVWVRLPPWAQKEGRLAQRQSA